MVTLLKLWVLARKEKSASLNQMIHTSQNELRSADDVTRFVSDSFQERLKLAQHAVLDSPLAMVVYPGDFALLQTAVGKVLEDYGTKAKAGSAREGTVQGGSLVYLRVGWDGLLFAASMTITIGTQGRIVITRLYNQLEVV